MSVSSTNESVQNSLYKTELCRSFEETGNCRYGKKCQFAHSVKEVRVLNRHPKVTPGDYNRCRPRQTYCFDVFISSRGPLQPNWAIKTMLPAVASPFHCALDP